MVGSCKDLHVVIARYIPPELILHHSLVRFFTRVLKYELLF